MDEWLFERWQQLMQIRDRLQELVRHPDEQRLRELEADIARMTDEAGEEYRAF